MLNAGQFTLLGCNQILLLCQLQCRCRARFIAGLHQAQHVLRVGQIQLGNPPLLARRQGLRIAVGDVGQQGQLHGRLIELAGAQALQCAVASRCDAAPEIHFIAGGQVAGEIVGVVVVGRVGLAVAVAQEPVTFAAQVKGQFRQQGRAADDGAGLCLTNPRHRRSDFVAVAAGLFDQAIQLRAAELLPPTHVAALRGGVFGKRPACRWLDAAVRRRGGCLAGAQQQTGSQNGETRLH